jgi:hypothetical protein
MLVYKEKQGYYTQQDYYRYLSLQGAAGILYSAGLLQVSKSTRSSRDNMLNRITTSMF